MVEATFLATGGTHTYRGHWWHSGGAGSGPGSGGIGVRGSGGVWGSGSGERGFVVVAQLIADRSVASQLTVGRKSSHTQLISADLSANKMRTQRM